MKSMHIITHHPEPPNYSLLLDTEFWWCEGASGCQYGPECQLTMGCHEGAGNHDTGCLMCDCAKDCHQYWELPW